MHPLKSEAGDERHLLHGDLTGTPALIKILQARKDCLIPLKLKKLQGATEQHKLDQ